MPDGTGTGGVPDANTLEPEPIMKSYLKLIAVGGLALGTSLAASAADPIAKYTRHKIMDKQGGGKVAASVLMPAGWKVNDELTWINDADYPTRYRGVYSGPDGLTSVRFYHDGVGSYTRSPSYNAGERPFESVIDGLKMLVPLARPGVKYKVVAEKAQDPVKKINPYGLGDNTALIGHTGMVRAAYELNGEMVEEEFMATYTISFMQFAPDNYTIATRFQAFSVRAPKGELAQAKEHAAVIRSTCTPTLEFFNEYEQVKAILLQTGIDAILEVGRRAAIWRAVNQQISQTIVDSYWARQASQDAAANNFSDYMRGVTNYRSTSGHTMKLPSGYSNAWENGNGEVILSNNGYDPNRDLNGTWKEMNRTR